MNEMRIAPAPLFRCPRYDGAADPCVIWNRQEKVWYMFYSQRVANSLLTGEHRMSFCHAMDVGIASFADHGRKCIYRGIAQGLDFEPGRNTWWRPHVVFNEDESLYHMWCTYVQGVHTDFDHQNRIVHYTSKDMWNWDFDRLIRPDAYQQHEGHVYRMPNGKWRMFFKEEDEPFILESTDLYDWELLGPPVKPIRHEAVNIFILGGKNWMIHDVYPGFGVYQSDDCENWERQDYDLLTEQGNRIDDGGRVHHSCVVELQDKVYIFYFSHPERVESIGGKLMYDLYHEDYNFRRTVIQVAEITLKDEKLYCSRTEPFDFYLPDIE